MSRQAKGLLTSEAKKFLAEDRVLVYHYRANGAPLVKNGLAVIPRRELEEILRTREFKPFRGSLSICLTNEPFRCTDIASDPTLRRSTKALPPRARALDIYQRDLVSTAPGTADAATHGNDVSNVAGIQLPLIVWLEGLLKGKGRGFKEVVVLSDKVGV